MKTQDMPTCVVDGKIQAVVCLDATIYFREMAREALIAAYDLLLAQMEGHISWYCTGTMQQAAPAKGKLRDLFRKWFGGKSRLRDAYELTLLSGKTDEEVGPWAFEFFVEPDNLPGEAGCLRFAMPVECLDQRDRPFSELVERVADVVPYRSGHAGYGVQFDGGHVLPKRDSTIRAWLKRYFCVDGRSLDVAGLQMAEYVKTAAWLTLLDADFVRKLGGLKRIQKQLPATIVVRQNRFGLSLQAGSIPVLGDSNTKEDISTYKAINRVIKPIRTPEHLPFDGLDKQDTEEWLRRFDEA